MSSTLHHHHHHNSAWCVFTLPEKLGTFWLSFILLCLLPDAHLIPSMPSQVPLLDFAQIHHCLGNQNFLSFIHFRDNLWNSFTLSAFPLSYYLSSYMRGDSSTSKSKVNPYKENRWQLLTCHGATALGGQVQHCRVFAPRRHHFLAQLVNQVHQRHVVAHGRNPCEGTHTTVTFLTQGWEMV